MIIETMATVVPTDGCFVTINPTSVFGALNNNWETSKSLKRTADEGGNLSC